MCAVKSRNTSRQCQKGPRPHTAAGDAGGSSPFCGIAAPSIPNSAKINKVQTPSYVGTPKTKIKWPRFYLPKVYVKSAAVSAALGVMSCCFLVELVCAAVTYCGAVPAAIAPSAWLIVYPTLGLALTCGMCVAWMRRSRNTCVRFADAALSQKPSDNIPTLKTLLVALFVVWGLCLVAGLPNWEKWAGIADTIVCCLPVAALLLLLFGFFFEEAYPRCEMWTMPADSAPTKSSVTLPQTDNNATCGALPLGTELDTPTVHPMEARGRESSEIHTLRMLYPLEMHLLDSNLQI
ncbi:cell surface protein [Anaplasma marginale]|nr:cell surface protein [Anaplasma marginale]